MDDFVPMQFREPKENSRASKIAYRDGLEALIRAREDRYAAERTKRCADIFTNAEEHRSRFCAMLGWPLTETRDHTVPETTEEVLGREGDYTILRVHISVLPELTLTGLYFQRDGDEKRPLVLVQHGGLGTPEYIAGFYEGQTANYNHMLERVLPYPVDVFAPQLLLWNKETYGEPYDRQIIDARLKRVGSSITAVEVYALQRAMDYFEESHTCFGMIGLSYGGFYTLYTSAIDTRIRSAVSGSFFSSRKEYPWTDWTWRDSAALYDDAEIACLSYPRRLCVQMGDHDELFHAEHTKTEADRVCQYCQTAGVSDDWFTCEIFDGTHELHKDDTAIRQLMKDIL